MKARSNLGSALLAAVTGGRHGAGPQPFPPTGRGPYKPHQGKRECARRVRQMARGVQP